MTPGVSSIVVVTSDPLLQLPVADLEHTFTVEMQTWTGPHGALPAQYLVDEIVARDPVVVCLAEDMPEGLALQTSRLIDELHRDIGVILIGQPTNELWRVAAQAGVRDVIQPEALSTDLTPAIAVAFERGERLRSESRISTETADPRHRVIVVLSPKGGSGKTMVSSNLAVTLAATRTGKTALVDLDCLFGDVAVVLGMTPEHTIGELAGLPSFDSTVLKVFLTLHEPSGLYVLAGSDSPAEGERVTDKLVVQVLEMLTRDFTYVVVDTSAGLDERALAAIDHASDLMFVGSMDVASIRNLAKEITALDRLELLPARRHFVLNRADTRTGLEVQDVESVIGMRVDAALPYSLMVPISMNHGTAVVLSEPKSEVAQELVRFAQRFIPVTNKPKINSGDRRNHFSIWRK